MSHKCADADGWPIFDLRDQNLFHQTFFVEVGRYERPHIQPTAEYDDSIRGCDWIGHDPKIG